MCIEYTKCQDYTCRRVNVLGANYNVPRYSDLDERMISLIPMRKIYNTRWYALPQARVLICARIASYDLLTIRIYARNVIIYVIRARNLHKCTVTKVNKVSLEKEDSQCRN